MPSFTCYAVRRGTSTALEHAGVPTDRVRRLIGHDASTTTYEDRYVSKRSDTDMQGIFAHGVQDASRVRYQGLERQTYAPLTAVQARRAEEADDVLMANEKLKEEAYRELVAAHGTTKSGFGSSEYAEWEEPVQRCRLRRLKVKQEAQRQRDQQTASAEHHSALAQLLQRNKESAVATASTSTASPSPLFSLPLVEVADAQQQCSDDTVGTREQRLSSPRSPASAASMGSQHTSTAILKRCAACSTRAPTSPPLTPPSGPGQPRATRPGFTTAPTARSCTLPTATPRARSSATSRHACERPFSQLCLSSSQRPSRQRMARGRFAPLPDCRARKELPAGIETDKDAESFFAHLNSYRLDKWIDPQTPASCLSAR